MATQKKRRSKYFNENRERLRLLKLSTNEISNLWYDAQTKAINLGLQTSYVNNNTTQLYTFSDYPELNKQMVKVVNTLTTDAVNAINAITEDAWQTANLKTDALIANLAATTGIDPKLLETFNQNNLNALAAFQNRKVAGMNLSKRVWNITGTFTQEMELALSVALAEGRSADNISRDVRHLLKYPDKLFRRVRNEFGQLVLSKAAQAFHPGRGVYRSSYKNALRLSATETNMAYLKSEHTRWDAMPFVVGYKIETCKQNHPKPDICDDLSGTYPKTFVFTGWHPFCRCITQAVMSSEKHFVQWLKNHEDAEDYTPPAGEVVKDVPQNFKTWIKNNTDRIAAAKERGTLPYFLKDNEWVIDGVKAKPAKEVKQEQSQGEKTYEERVQSFLQGDLKNMKLTEEEKEAMAKNWVEIEDYFGIKKGALMTHEQADIQSANPNYSIDYGYTVNCATCSPCYVLREMGFDIIANSKYATEHNKWMAVNRNSFRVWIETDKSQAIGTSFNDWLKKHEDYKQMSPKRYQEFFEEACKEEGTYIVLVTWKGRTSGHATIIKKTNDGIFYIEPQTKAGLKSESNALRPLSDLYNSMSPKPYFCDGVLRVDNKTFNVEYLDIFTAKKSQ